MRRPDPKDLGENRKVHFYKASRYWHYYKMRSVWCFEWQKRVWKLWLCWAFGRKKNRSGVSLKRRRMTTPPVLYRKTHPWAPLTILKGPFQANRGHLKQTNSLQVWTTETRACFERDKGYKRAFMTDTSWRNTFLVSISSQAWKWSTSCVV